MLFGQLWPLSCPVCVHTYQATACQARFILFFPWLTNWFFFRECASATTAPGCYRCCGRKQGCLSPVSESLSLLRTTQDSSDWVGQFFPSTLLVFTSLSPPMPCFIRDSAHRVHPLAGLGVNLGFGDVACLHRLLVSAAGKGEEWGEESRTLLLVGQIQGKYMAFLLQVLFRRSISTRLNDRDTICQSCPLLKVCIDSSPPRPHQWSCSALWDSS